MTEQQPETVEKSVDEERERFGSAGWDATDPDTGSLPEVDPTQDVPKPEPDQDQG